PPTLIGRFETFCPAMAARSGGLWLVIRPVGLRRGTRRGAPEEVGERGSGPGDSRDQGSLEFWPPCRGRACLGCRRSPLKQTTQRWLGLPSRAANYQSLQPIPSLVESANSPSLHHRIGDCEKPPCVHSYRSQTGQPLFQGGVCQPRPTRER